MRDKNKIIKNFAGFALTTGIALATQAGPSLFLGVLNSFSTGIATNLLQKVNYKKIKNLIQDTDPSDLNHDIKKLIIKSIELTIKNIEFLYKRQLINKHKIKELKKFTDQLLEETKVLNHLLEDKPDSIFREIEDATDSEKLLQSFSLDLSEFPTINPDLPYPTFFKEQFKSNLQLCFSELLKAEENRPALIAYQREIYKSIEEKLDNISNKNNEILNKLSSQEEKEEVKSYNESISEIKYYLTSKNTNTLLPEFKEQLDIQYQELSKQTELLVDIKGMTKGFLVELKKNWISKNKVSILTVGFILIVIIASLLYYNWSLPFNMIINIKKNPVINIHPQYPVLGIRKNTRIKINLEPEPQLKNITLENGLVFPDLNKNYLGDTISIQLLDKYWKLSEDFIVIQEGNLDLLIEPNESLAKIEGHVLEKKGGAPIKNAKVSMEGLEVSSDLNGMFSILVPVEKRREIYDLVIKKEGFQPYPYTKKYYPGTPVPISLIQKK